MPFKTDLEHRGQDTRRRILEAALLRFAQFSYEETRLRDIAADVGVDVAYVHRVVGSKDRLFAEIVKIAFEPRGLFAAELPELAPRLTARFFEPSLDQAMRLIDPMDILVRSLLSPEAVPVLREALDRDVIAQLAPKLEGAAAQRAAVLAAFLAGIGIFRHVLRTEPMLEEAGGELGELITRVIDTIVGYPSAAIPAPTVSKAPKVAGRRTGRKSV